MAQAKAEEKPQEEKKEDGKPLANGVKKDEEEELVIPRVNSRLLQSEEDLNLKNELETLVERLKVTFFVNDADNTGR
jgi:hypothetical protein